MVETRAEAPSAGEFHAVIHGRWRASKKPCLLVGVKRYLDYFEAAVGVAGVGGGEYGEYGTECGVPWAGSSAL